MHTTEWHGKRHEYSRNEEEVDVYMHHNGDYSGDVIITIRPPSIDDEEEFVVPFEALAELVGHAVFSSKIRELEEKTGMEILGLK